MLFMSERFIYKEIGVAWYIHLYWLWKIHRAIFNDEPPTQDPPDNYIEETVQNTLEKVDEDGRYILD